MGAKMKRDVVYKSKVMYVLQSIEKLADGKTKVSLYGPAKEMHLSNALTHVVASTCCDKIGPRTYKWVARDPDNEMVEDILDAMVEYNAEKKKNAKAKVNTQSDESVEKVEDDVETVSQVESEQLTLNMDEEEQPDSECNDKKEDSIIEQEEIIHSTEKPIELVKDINILWGMIKIRKYGK